MHRYSCVFHWFLHVTYELLVCHLTHDQNDTLMQEDNASKFRICESDTKHKQEPWYVNWLKLYLKVLYNAYALPLMGNSNGQF